MPKARLLVLAATVLAFSPVLNPARSQSGQDSTPAQPSQAAPTVPSQGSPAPAMAPAPAVTPAPATYPKNNVKPTAESQAKAKGLYAIDCAMCHGDNGNGKTDLATSMELTLTDWTDPKSLAARQDGELFLVIRNGKDKMPPEESGRASDEMLWNLIYYIRRFSKSGNVSAQN